MDHCHSKKVTLMRILIYGAGVIGSLYAALISDTGMDVTVYARGKRLSCLQEKGLLYRKNGQVHKANVKVISSLSDNDSYDFIFLTVREDQLMTALAELKDNVSPTIVTMVNSLDTYESWREYAERAVSFLGFPEQAAA